MKTTSQNITDLKNKLNFILGYNEYAKNGLSAKSGNAYFNLGIGFAQVQYSTKQK